GIRDFHVTGVQTCALPISQLVALGFEQVDVAVNFADTTRYWEALGELVAPQGHVGLIVEPSGPLEIGDPYKLKSIGIHWELMFKIGRASCRARGEASVART